MAYVFHLIYLIKIKVCLGCIACSSNFCPLFFYYQFVGFKFVIGLTTSSNKNLMLKNLMFDGKNVLLATSVLVT